MNVDLDLDGNLGLNWRVIGTDTESDSGVAPACPKPEEHVVTHHGDVDDGNVFECCVGPHLECWTEGNAREVRDTLNRLSVEVCS